MNEKLAKLLSKFLGKSAERDSRERKLNVGAAPIPLELKDKKK
ncbi:hypothetical protein NQ117_03970 [Paenibacillus sp. SC116]|nr:hypothetical protein [Paenibacillus sp. SC116]MCR8842830.1 hypothetical protein [Paenibacillus sp. SC116]